MRFTSSRANAASRGETRNVPEAARVAPPFGFAAACPREAMGRYPPSGPRPRRVAPDPSTAVSVSGRVKWFDDAKGFAALVLSAIAQRRAGAR